MLHAEAPDGVLIAYRTVGEVVSDDGTPPVLLVHGFASDSAVTWEGTGWVRALQDAGRSVILVDLRGHGESDKPSDGDAYSPDRLGADHPLTTSWAYDAGLLQVAGRKFADADRLLTASLAGREKTLGPNHPATLASLWLAFVVYQLRGRALLPLYDPEFAEALKHVRIA